MSTQSEDRPNLRSLHNQAKRFLKALQSSDPEILERVLSAHPKWADSSESELLVEEFTLRVAQLQNRLGPGGSRGGISILQRSGFRKGASPCEGTPTP